MTRRLSEVVVVAAWSWPVVEGTLAEVAAVPGTCDVARPAAAAGGTRAGRRRPLAARKPCPENAAKSVPYYYYFLLAHFPSSLPGAGARLPGRTRPDRPGTG